MAISFGSSFMLVSSFLLAVMFISPSFAHKGKSPVDLKHICSHTINHHWCLKFLKSDHRIRGTRANLRRLAEVSIDLANAKAKAVHTQLNLLSANATDSQLKGRYASCSKNYNDAIRDLKLTMSLFDALHPVELSDRGVDSGNYKRIVIQVEDALQEVSSCKSQFREDPTDPSNFPRMNREFELFCDVVRVTTNALAKQSYTISV